MREIKFRAWDLISNRYVYLNDVLCSVKYYEIFCHTPDDRPWEIEQFTGLLDKNGLEYFEGDLGKYKGKIFKIEWSVYGFAIFVHRPSDKIDWLNASIVWPHDWIYDIVQISEKIGNIHQNPELLE